MLNIFTIEFVAVVYTQTMIWKIFRTAIVRTVVQKWTEVNQNENL